MRVFCLCAAWCTACAEYKAVFQAVQTDFSKRFTNKVCFSWVDVEDQADVVDPLELENFPTLLIAQEDRAVFLGPLTPQRQTLERMLTHFFAQAQAPINGSQSQTSTPNPNQIEAQALLQRLLAAGL